MRVFELYRVPLDEPHGVSGQDREVRILVLRMALRRLLAAAQSYIESGEGFDILAVAMSHAAEVLTLNGEQCTTGME